MSDGQLWSTKAVMSVGPTDFPSYVESTKEGERSMQRLMP